MCPPSPAGERTADLLENPVKEWLAGVLRTKHKGEDRAWGHCLCREEGEGGGLCKQVRLYRGAGARVGTVVKGSVRTAWSPKTSLGRRAGREGGREGGRTQLRGLLPWASIQLCY